MALPDDLHLEVESVLIDWLTEVDGVAPGVNSMHPVAKVHVRVLWDNPPIPRFDEEICIPGLAVQVAKAIEEWAQDQASKDFEHLSQSS